MKNTRFLAWSCTHFPYANEGAIDWLCNIAEETKPDVLVHLGDLIDAEGASRWSTAADAGHTLEEEYREADEFLRRIRRVARPKQCVFMEGNHDSNISRSGRLPKALRSLCDWRLHIDEISKGNWKVYPYRFPTQRHNGMSGVFRIGQVSFLHGYTTGPRADANAALDFGKDYGLTIQGHTHSPTNGVERVFYSPKRPSNRYVCNVGMMANLDELEYCHRFNTALWGTACVVGEAPDLKSPRESITWTAEQFLYE